MGSVLGFLFYFGGVFWVFKNRYSVILMTSLTVDHVCVYTSPLACSTVNLRLEEK